MNRRVLAAILLLLTMSSSAIAAPPKSEKPITAVLTGQPRQDFLDGVALLESGDFPHALAKFRRAYEASKQPRILWNVALCHERMHRYVLARDTLQRYIEETRAAGELSAKDEADAQGFIKSFGRLIGRIRLEISESAAVVTVDGQAVRDSVVDVEEGEHQVSVTKDGFRPWSSTVHVDGQAEAAVPVKLTAERHQGRLVVLAPPGAVIHVDGKAVGLGSIDVPSSSGTHHLTVSAPERRTRDFDVLVSDDQVRRIEVSLDKETKTTSSMPLWPWLVGGSVVVAGAITAGVLIASHSEASLKTPATSLGSTIVP